MLVREAQADLALIDERKARKKAAELGFRHIGLVGILLEAKAKKYIDQVAPVLDDLIQIAGFWVGEALYAKVLQVAGEGP